MESGAENRYMSDPLKLSFHGPARKGEFFDDGRRRTNYLSLAHWMEASKFDSTVHYETRAATVLMPAVKEVVKFSAAHKHLWRSDWPMVRSKSMLQGLGFLQQEHPDHPIWKHHHMLLRILAVLGFSPMMAEGIAKQHIEQMQSTRVMVLGAGAVPAEELNKRIRLLNRKTNGNWRLVHWLGRHGSWGLHDWVDSQRMPITYCGEDKSRLTPAHLSALLDHIDHCLVFEKKGAKGMERIVQGVKKAGRSCDVAVWNEEVSRSLDLFDQD